MAEFHQRLKEVREKTKRRNPKWTQGFVADKIGVARSTYTAYENGTKLPPLGTVNTLADLFEVTTDYLLGRSETPNLINSKQMSVEDTDTFSYNGQEVNLNELTPDQRVLIEWAISRESLSFKDKPQDLYDLLDRIRNIKPYIDEIEKKEKNSPS